MTNNPSRKRRTPRVISFRADPETDAALDLMRDHLDTTALPGLLIQQATRHQLARLALILYARTLDGSND